MTCAIASQSIAHQWSTPICSVIDFSLGQGMAQNRAPLPIAAMAHQWRNRVSRASRLIRFAPPALCLRRRLEAHRWSPSVDHGGRAFTHDQSPRPHTVEIEGAHAHTRAFPLRCFSHARISVDTFPGLSGSEHLAGHDSIRESDQWLTWQWPCSGNIGVTAKPLAQRLSSQTAWHRGPQDRGYAGRPRNSTVSLKFVRSISPHDAAPEALSDFPRTSWCVVRFLFAAHRRAVICGGAQMKREKVTFEAEPEVKTELEAWAREEDRSVGSLLRRIVEKAAHERRAAAVVSEAQ